ncbi:MAG: signal recognition particle-docking protein FtsY [Candidatus Methylacidiphilales bacterium]|nr:signal recognition particle-docking protein FtsY [Candidatus Methylacidiphilales bacterium]
MIGIFRKWISEARGGRVDWEELEAMLIQADLGYALVQRILARLKDRPLNAENIGAAARTEITALWPRVPAPPVPADGEVWMVIGINGAGKTTTLAKLAHRYQNRGVHLVAADTFRAAAIEQLRVWSERVGCGFTAGREGGDPAAAAYQGVEDGRRAGAGLILIDTAGRLHNKDNLLRELEKVKRVVGKNDPGSPHHTLLVVDGTNGANALLQAEQFHKSVGLTGLIATKLDSTAKGGAIAAIKSELGLDTFFIGTGESPEDLRPFSPDEYVDRFF